MMTSATSLQQLKTFLAIPATLRSVLVQSAFTSTRPRPIQSHAGHALVCTRHYASVKFPNVAAFVIPEYRTSPIVDVTPGDLFKHSSLTSAPDEPLEDELNKLYTKNPATFIYAESDFYKLKKNTRVPEVCILGRSNVGKSSFINALANRLSKHLANVSSKAGRTRSINAYGFGPAPTIQELQAQAGKFRDEELPNHTFHLVDMPGYGHASLKEWGKNISLYISKRTSLKGAILLIDAEVGPKDSDHHLLELLSNAQLKTAVVLTKADKVKKGLTGLQETCQKVWETLQAVEARTTEGNWVWEKDVYVTAVGARDSAVVKSTVTTARLAVARLAGLVKDTRPQEDKNKAWSGKIISFDELFGPSEPSEPDTSTSPSKSTRPEEESPFIPKPSSNRPKRTSTFEELEQTVAVPRSSRSPSRVENINSFDEFEQAVAATATSRSHSPNNSRTLHTRRFHSSAMQTSDLPPEKPSAAELKSLVKEFLKNITTDTPRDWVRRLWEERERAPQKFFNISKEQIRADQLRYLQKKYSALTERARTIYLRRVRIEERLSKIRAAEEEREFEAAGNFGEKPRKTTPVARDEFDEEGEDVEDDPNNSDETVQTSSATGEQKYNAKKQRKQSRKKGRNSKKADSEE